MGEGVWGEGVSGWVRVLVSGWMIPGMNELLDRTLLTLS